MELKELLKKAIAYHPILAEKFGGIKEDVYLQQIMFWSDKGKREDGWIYKTIKDFQEETYIKKGSQERIRNKFVKLKILEVKIMKVKGTPKTHFQINWNALASKLESPKTGKSESPKIGQSESPKTGKSSITENTTENTTEIAKKKTFLHGKEWNDLIDAFKEVNPLYEEFYKNKTERKALDIVAKKYGKEKTKLIITFLPKSNTIKFVPKITKPTELKRNVAKLMAWASEKKNSKKGKVVSFKKS